MPRVCFCTCASAFPRAGLVSPALPLHVRLMNTWPPDSVNELRFSGAATREALGSRLLQRLRGSLSPGPWAAWASVCLTPSVLGLILYPHTGMIYSASLLYPSCFYDHIHVTHPTASVCPFNHLASVSFLWDYSSQKRNQRLISFFLPLVLITYAAVRHKQRLIKSFCGPCWFGCTGMMGTEGRKKGRS